MARTQSVTDEEILQAAKRVIWRRGYDAFTLSDVAEEVGLSRAAIILRFQNTRALKLTLTARMVDEFTARLAALPSSRDGEGLIGLARFVGAAIGSKTSTRAFMVRVRVNRDDPELVDGLRTQVADELAAAAGLVMGKAEGVPAAIVRGYSCGGAAQTAAKIIRPAGVCNTLVTVMDTSCPMCERPCSTTTIVPSSR